MPPPHVSLFDIHLQYSSGSLSRKAELYSFGFALISDIIILLIISGLSSFWLIAKLIALKRQELSAAISFFLIEYLE